MEVDPGGKIWDASPKYGKYGGRSVRGLSAKEGLELVGEISQGGQATKESRFVAAVLDSVHGKEWRPYETKQTKYLNVMVMRNTGKARDAEIRVGNMKGKRISELSMRMVAKVKEKMKGEDDEGYKRVCEIAERLSEPEHIDEPQREAVIDQEDIEDDRRRWNDGRIRWSDRVRWARETLVVGEGSTREEIVKRERVLSQKVHPDKGGSGQLFKDVKEAAKLLKENYAKQTKAARESGCGR